MKKLYVVLCFLVAGLLFANCSGDIVDNVDLNAGGAKKNKEIDVNGIRVEKVALGDVPDGIEPLPASSMEDALVCFKADLQDIYGNLPDNSFDPSLLKVNTPLLKTRSESGGATLPPAEGMQMASYYSGLITVYVGMQWEKLLGEISVSSWLGGLTTGSTWEQKLAEASWYYDGETDSWAIYYRIVAVYKTYVFWEGSIELLTYTYDFSDIVYLNS